MQELDPKSFSGVMRPFPLFWITTQSGSGPNIAPMVTLTGLTHIPVRLIIAINPRRKTFKNIEKNPELVASIPFGDEETLDTLWDSAWGGFREGEDKFSILGIETAPSSIVKPPRLKKCIASVEMRVLEILKPSDTSGTDRPVMVLEPVACFVNSDYYDMESKKYRSGTPIPLHYGGNKFCVLEKEIIAGKELRERGKILHGKDYLAYISSDDTAFASGNLLERIRRHRS